MICGFSLLSNQGMLTFHHQLNDAADGGGRNSSYDRPVPPPQYGWCTGFFRGRGTVSFKPSESRLGTRGNLCKLMEQTLQIAIAHERTETRDALHAAVAQLGHAVCVHAGSGRELIDSSRRPDLVIVQETLPDMNGLHAVHEAVGDVAIPIIVVLDAQNGRLLRQQDSQGVMAVLNEPVRSSDAIPVIPLAMQQFEQLQAVRDRVELLKEALSEES